MTRVVVDEELSSDLTAPWRARQRVREQLRGASCEDDAGLVASELVTNAVSYGAPPIRLRLRVLPHRVCIEVHDGTVLVQLERLGFTRTCNR
jgi:anti-sigma regulatory factor (Ser/Thr protein kinase)